MSTPPPTWRQLSGHAAGHLYSDTVQASANVSLVQIHDQRTAPGGVVRFKSILAQVESRLHAAPLFRQRLQRVPLGLDRPYWVDDEHFDLEYHVRHIALPKPGDWRQFCIQASRIHARALDLDRPLWELYVIEGLDSFLDLSPGSFALLFKTHQAALDLHELAQLTDWLYDAQPSPAPPAPPLPWFADAAPGALSLVAKGLQRSASAPLRLARPLAQAATHVAPAAVALASEVLLRPDHLPPTRFNSVVSPHRVFETRRFTQAEFDAIAQQVPGANHDDVALAVVGGALRLYLDAEGELPEGQSLTAILPVLGCDDSADRADPGAREPLTWRHLGLATDLADPLARLRRIQAQRRAAPDAVARTLGAPALGELAEQASAALLGWSRRWVGKAAARLGAHAPPAHCSVALLPSPSGPRFLCGARLTYTSALLPIRDGLGLAFAVTHCDGRVIVSPTACRELMPDPEVFAQCLRDSFQALLAQAQSQAQTQGAVAPARRAPTARRAPAQARRVKSAAPRGSSAGKPRRPAPGA